MKNRFTETSKTRAKGPPKLLQKPTVTLRQIRRAVAQERNKKSKP